MRTEEQERKYQELERRRQNINLADFDASDAIEYVRLNALSAYVPPVSEVINAIIDENDSEDDDRPHCDCCERVIEHGDELGDPFGNGDIMCQTCFDEKYFTCQDCDEFALMDSSQIVYSRIGAQKHVCGTCSSDYMYCNGCQRTMDDSVMTPDSDDTAFCFYCRDSGRGNFRDTQNNQPRTTFGSTMTASPEFLDILRQGMITPQPQQRGSFRNDVTVKDFQSEEIGSLIKDQRMFSAEIECYPASEKGKQKMLDTVLSSFNGTGVTTDASLNSGGMEFQTPILKGKYGEKYMKDFSAKLIANKFFIDKRCGLHIHLDGDQFTLESIAKNSQNVLKKVSWFFNCGKSTQGYKNGIQELRKYSRYNDGGNYRDWYPDAKNVKDMTTEQLSKAVHEYQIEQDIEFGKSQSLSSAEDVEILTNKINECIAKLESILTDTELHHYRQYVGGDATRIYFSRIKNLFTTYYFADEVIMQFLPFSRRNNKYCLPLWKEFAIDKVDSMTTIEEFDAYWYKEDSINENKRRKSDPHDHSRRHGANFHILMSQGHFELRYHSGTLNAHKILYWVQLNQALMNLALSSNFGHIYMDGNERKSDGIRYELEQIRHILNLKQKRYHLYKLLKLPKDAITYWESRAEKFTGDQELSDGGRSDTDNQGI